MSAAVQVHIEGVRSPATGHTAPAANFLPNRPLKNHMYMLGSQHNPLSQAVHC